MNTTGIFGLRDLDHVMMALIGITAPIAIEHYHHLLFGDINNYSNGILVYITAFSLFVLVILILSPAYYGVVKGIYLCINHRHSCSLSIAPSIMQDFSKGGHDMFISAVVYSPNNVNSSRPCTFHLPLIDNLEKNSYDISKGMSTEATEDEYVTATEMSNDSEKLETIKKKSLV